MRLMLRMPRRLAVVVELGPYHLERSILRRLAIWSASEPQLVRISPLHSLSRITSPQVRPAKLSQSLIRLKIKIFCLLRHQERRFSSSGEVGMHHLRTQAAVIST